MLPTFPPPFQLPNAGANRAMVSTRCMPARSPSRNSRCQFHKQPATKHRHKTSKPSRPITDFCSVIARVHQKSKKVSRATCAWVFAVFASLRTINVHLQSRNPRLFRRRNTFEEHCACQSRELYSLAFAHLASRALANAFSFASLTWFFVFFGSLAGFSASVAGASPLLAAHRAFAAAWMFARPSGLIFFLFFRLPFDGP